MSFVGTRPEAVKYVEKYKPEYMATLLLPAGITSEASIRYKDEAELLNGAEDDKIFKGSEVCSVCGKSHNIVCINDSNINLREVDLLPDM